MSRLLGVFDAYSLRARLFPAVIAVAPALTALVLLIPWSSFGISRTLGAAAALVVGFAMSEIARSLGRALEPRLFSEFGGKPSITMFRRGDSAIDEGLKDRYRAFLAGELGLAAPNQAVEQAEQALADSFYEQCGVWLRKNTRDAQAFSLLFNENVSYGFRRNLLGLKWLGLALDLAVAIPSLEVLRSGGWRLEGEHEQRAIEMLALTTVHVAYLLYAARPAAVREAARAYARELILSCEAFLQKPSSFARSD